MAREHFEMQPSDAMRFKGLVTATTYAISVGKGERYLNLPHLTLSPPIPLKLYTLPYWSNQPFLFFDIRAIWRSLLSARSPECQKLKMVG